MSKNIANVAHYYGTLLTSPRSYQGHNRRTSIAAGVGDVAHPELEMVGMVGTEHHSHEEHRHLKELEERVFSKARVGTGLSRSETGFSMNENPFRMGSPFKRARTSTSLAEEDEEADPLA